MNLIVDPHPSLDLAAFVTHFPGPLGQLETPDWLVEQMAAEADVPLQRDEETRTAVRDLLRYGGYKPTGRGKPASEYLVRAAEGGMLNPINPAVDACNVVSLHSGLPISVVDLDRASAPFRVGLADPDAAYVFNAAGQVIKVGGLLCLQDDAGPCANAVKDAQRTKTYDGTVRTLSLLWGTKRLTDQTARALAWYRGLLDKMGARTELVHPV